MARADSVIGVFDVGYSDASARVGCVSLADFEDIVPNREWVVEVGPVGPYQPGQFWRRELTPLLRGIDSATDLSICVIDAYVDLGEARMPGLGRILYETTGIPVIGVAKSRYQDSPREYEIHRGSSRRPLHVSAAGFDQQEAKECIMRMAGTGRVPAMIRRADQLSRGIAPQP
ncbi:MAG: endonuclease V [bacterium]|nr:endonuclease V [bacterium]MCP4306287.1 endonuclease V [bacterium]